MKASAPLSTDAKKAAPDNLGRLRFLSFLLRELKPPDLTPVRAAAVSLLPEEKASVTGENRPHWKYG